jgi:hypothetical protein
MNKRNMTFAKRQREQEQKDRARERAARRGDRKLRKAEGRVADGAEDPDIAGIVPGPQPKADDE